MWLLELWLSSIGEFATWLWGCIKRNAGFLVAVAIALAFLLGWVGMSAMEAESYNRLTGGRATVWDAMFTSLRVVGMEKQ